MNIIISGCGNVGFETLKQLVSRFPKARIAVCDKMLPEYLKCYLAQPEAINVNFIAVNMTDLKSTEKAFANIGFRNVDALISTIGMASGASALDDFDAFMIDFNVNYFGNVHPVKRVLASMTGNNSKIVIVLSSSSFQAPGVTVAYAPAKWALLNFCFSLQSELVNSGIKVLPIVPGNIANQSSKCFTHTKGLSAKRVADLVVKLLADDNHSSKTNKIYCLPFHIYLAKVIERLLPDIQDWRFGLRHKYSRKNAFSRYKIQNALITGASKGLGRKLAYIYSKRLKELHLVARNIIALETIKRDIELNSHCRVFIYSLDLSNLCAVKRFAEAISNVDLVINNAGYAILGRVEEISPNEYRNNLAVNFFAPVLITSELMKRPVQPKKIINVLSTTAVVGRSNYSAYSSTKAALWAFTRCFRRRYGSKLQVLEVMVSSFIEPELCKDVIKRSIFGRFFRPDKLNLMHVANQIEEYEKKGRERLTMPFRSKLFLMFESLLPRVFRLVFP